MLKCKLLIFGLFLLSGCATAPYVPTPKPEIAVPGIYHRVQRGETLWRISKIYGMDLEKIVQANRISDAGNIEVGQLILIPQASAKRQFLSREASARLEDFIWPMKGKIITYFGQSYNNMVNKGINIQPYRADAEVVAARSGKIIFSTQDFAGFGKTIIIDHGDGFSTVYARNSQVFVSVGESVEKGALIAKVGSTNRDKNIYLHFQIRKGHLPQNPYFYLSN